MRRISNRNRKFNFATVAAFGHFATFEHSLHRARTRTRARVFRYSRRPLAELLFLTQLLRTSCTIPP